MSIINITKENFEDTVANGITIIKMGANFCGPCRAMKPILESLADDNIYSIGDCDIEEQQELAMKHRVSSIPHSFIYQDGEQVGDFMGMKSKDEIIELIKVATNG